MERLVANRKPRRRKALVTAGLVALSAAVVGVYAPAAASGANTSGLSPQVVLDWNLNAVTAVRSATPPKLQVEGVIYMAYAQAAVYDAVTKINHRYVPYHDFDADASGASPQAAVVSAAYNTLVAYLGDPGGVLKAKYAASLAALPDAGKAAGIAVGKAAADDLVALRAGDGLRAVVTTPYGQCVTACPPGLWVFAPPPAAQAAAAPWLAFMRPFMLQSPSQFRAEPPPSLTSQAYTDEFNEIKAYGAKDSTVRTPEQTAVAWFWLANVINQDNQALRDLITRRGMDLTDAARALAMGDMVVGDATIACFDSKYLYQFWRPITAIRNAGIDGNPDTIADPSWTPLALTPQHPDYPSAHGCGVGALAEVFASLEGTKRINLDIPGAQGGAATVTTSRHYATVHDLLQELVNARVWVGYHFRGSVVAGVDIGQDVARWTLKRYFLPVEDENNVDREDT